MSKKKVMAGSLAAAGLFIVLMIILMNIRGTKEERAVVVKKHVEDYYTEEGVLSAGNRYQVIAEVSGAVKEIAVEENMKVKKGDILLLVDSSDYEHEKYRAECAIAGYEAQLQENRIKRLTETSPKEYMDAIKQEATAKEAAYQTAKTIHEGSRVLYESGDISRVEMEQREAEYQSSLLSMEQAKSRYEESRRVLSGLEDEGMGEQEINDQFYESEEKQLTALIEAQKHQAVQLEEKIANCRITAPEDGIITELPSKDFTVVQFGQTVASITGTGRMTAEADVLTNIAPYLKTGDPAEVILRLRGKDISIVGQISQVYDFARQGISTLGLSEYRVHVVIDLDEEQAQELTGMDGYGVYVKFCLFDEENCLTVPAGAVFQEDGKYYVYKYKRNRAGKQEVELKYRSGSECVIEEGLSEGEIVIEQAASEGD